MQQGHAGQKAWFMSQVGQWDGLRFHHTIQNGVKLKIYAFFIYGICHLIFLDCS